MTFAVRHLMSAVNLPKVTFKPHTTNNLQSPSQQLDSNRANNNQLENKLPVAADAVYDKLTTSLSRASLGDDGGKEDNHYTNSLHVGGDDLETFWVSLGDHQTLPLDKLKDALWNYVSSNLLKREQFNAACDATLKSDPSSTEVTKAFFIDEFKARYGPEVTTAIRHLTSLVNPNTNKIVEWFRPHLNREQAELAIKSILLANQLSKAFIMRISTNKRLFAWSVWDANRREHAHFMVQNTNGQFHLREGKTKDKMYDSLSDLISNESQSSLNPGI